MSIVVLGIDLGKASCSLVGLDDTGAVGCASPVAAGHCGEVRRRPAALHRGDGGVLRAHHLGRVFGGQGHEVRLMSPEYVRAYVKA